MLKRHPFPFAAHNIDAWARGDCFEKRRAEPLQQRAGWIEQMQLSLWHDGIKAGKC